MANPKPRITVKFSQVGEKPLAKQIIGIRVPENIYQAIQSLPNSIRSEWLRKALADAVERDGLISN